MFSCNPVSEGGLCYCLLSRPTTWSFISNVAILSFSPLWLSEQGDSLPKAGVSLPSPSRTTARGQSQAGKPKYFPWPRLSGPEGRHPISQRTFTFSSMLPLIEAVPGLTDPGNKKRLRKDLARLLGMVACRGPWDGEAGNSSASWVLLPLPFEIFAIFVPHRTFIKMSVRCSVFLDRGTTGC